MELYSRLLPSQVKAADEDMALLLNYPLERRAEGITVKELMTDYPDRLKDRRSLIAALYMLAHEDKVRIEKSGTNLDWLRVIPVLQPI